MKPRRLLPYLAALLLLAWVLGSLARSGAGGGSLLANSYWLVYLIELLPLVALGLMVALGILLLVHARDLSEGLGFGMSQRTLRRKKKRNYVTIVWMAVWGVAIAVLMARCGGFSCNANSSVQNTAGTVESFVSGPGPFPQVPLLAPALAVARLVDTNYFVLALLGLLGLSSVIMARAFKVYLDETRAGFLENFQRVQEEGRVAAQEAISVLEGEENGDPRTRILACYQRMIRAAAGLGAPVGLDRTARELEKGIRGMFLLKGSGITRLTRLFEEARYSLHPVSEEDNLAARDCLLEIREELGRTVSVEA